MTRPKSEIPIALALLMVSAVIQFALLAPGHNWGGDFSAYLHQATAVANGSVAELDSIVRFRIENSTPNWVIGPDYYPWGFPALLAAVFVLFGNSLLVGKVTMILFALGSQVATYLLLRGRNSTLCALAVSFAFVVNAYFLVFESRVLSDIPFMFFVLLTLLLCRYFLLERDSPSISNLIVIGLTMFVAFSIRTHAIALLPTVAMLQVIGKTDTSRRTSILAILGSLKKIRIKDLVPHAVFFVGAATLAVSLSDPIESYASTGQVPTPSADRLIATIKFGLYYYGVLPNGFFSAPTIVYVLIIVPMILLGVFNSGMKNPELLGYTIVHMAILMVYPGRQGIRFILPILPVLLFFLFVGVQQIVNWVASKVTDPAPTGVIDGVLAFSMVVLMAGPAAINGLQTSSGKSAGYNKIGPYSPTSQEAFAFIRDHTGPDQSVVFWKPRVLSYLTGRNSAVVISYEELVSGRFDYVLIYRAEYPDTEKGKVLGLFTNEFPEAFESVYSNADFDLYKIIPPATPAPT